MRKLIEVEQSILIQCDNTKCDYTIPNETKDPNANTKQYINKPCPECGYNLLTPRDYEDGERLMRIINWMNKWFSWVTYFIPKKHESKGSIHVHNGVDVKMEDD